MKTPAMLLATAPLGEPHPAPLNALPAQISQGIIPAGQRGMLVFDLDGTFADLYETETGKSRYEDPDKTLNANMQAFLNFKNRTQSRLIYASARTLSNFQKFQKELLQRGITLPTPDDYVANNGNFIYNNVDGSLVEDAAYSAELLRRTRFDRDAIYAMLKELGAQDRYRLSGGVRDIPAPDGTPVKLTDFAESQLAYYEFFPTESFIELMYSPAAQASIEKDLTEGLNRLGVQFSLTWKKFPAANLDWIAAEAQKRPELAQILRLARPTRLDQDGGLYTVHISAARKRTAVEYLMERLGVAPEEVIAAGNDMNDLSLAELARDRGAWFISVANAPADFKREVQAISIDLYRRKALEGSKRVRQMVLHEGNESVRFGLNLVRSDLHDAKAKHYREEIERILASRPANEAEAVVMAELNSPASQEALIEDAWKMFWTMPDHFPDMWAMDLAMRTAMDKELIRLIEAANIGKLFRWS